MSQSRDYGFLELATHAYDDRKAYRLEWIDAHEKVWLTKGWETGFFWEEKIHMALFKKQQMIAFYFIFTEWSTILVRIGRRVVRVVLMALRRWAIDNRFSIDCQPIKYYVDSASLCTCTTNSLHHILQAKVIGGDCFSYEGTYHKRRYLLLLCCLFRHTRFVPAAWSMLATVSPRLTLANLALGHGPASFSSCFLFQFWYIMIKIRLFKVPSNEKWRAYMFLSTSCWTPPLTIVKMRLPQWKCDSSQPVWNPLLVCAIDSKSISMKWYGIVPHDFHFTMHPGRERPRACSGQDFGLLNQLCINFLYFL